MATVGTFSKTRLHAAGSPRRHPQLLPHQGTLWSGGSDQRQHQNPSSKGPWLQESRLSAAQGSTHGGHQDRIPSGHYCLSRSRSHPDNFLFHETFFPAAHFLSVEEVGVIAVTTQPIAKFGVPSFVPTTEPYRVLSR